MTVLLGWQKTKAFYIQRSSIDHPPKADKLVYVDGGLYIATQKEILHSLVQNERRKPLVRDCCVIIRDDHELLEVIGPSTHTGRICYRLKPQMPTASQVT